MKVLIGRPDWKDLPLQSITCGAPRFDHLMAYMYWMVGELANRAKNNMDVKVLDGVAVTKENINLQLSSFNPDAYVHGSHMICNAAQGAPYSPSSSDSSTQTASFVICSPPGQEQCCSNLDRCLLYGNLTRDCGSSNTAYFAGKIVYLIGCIAGRILAPAMVNAGAKAVIAYDDLLAFQLGCTPSDYWFEECFLDVYVGIFDRLREGKTVREAVEWGKRKYQYWIDYVKAHGNNSKMLYALQWDLDYLNYYGDGNAKLQPSTPPFHEVIVKPIFYIPLTLTLVGAASFGIGFILSRSGGKD